MRHGRRSADLIALGLLAVLLGGACNSGELAGLKPNGDFVEDDDDLHPDTEDPGGDTGPGGRPLIYSGQYELTSIVDLAGSGIFGETISVTLVELSQFHEKPAGTILRLLALYEVPYYTQVWTVLPGFIKDPVAGLLDDLIRDHVFANVKAIDKAFQIVDDIASVSRNVELKTRMSLRPPGAIPEVLRGEHIMTGVGFRLWSWNAEVPIPMDFAQIAQLDVRATLEPTEFPEDIGAEKGARVTFSKQNFAIPYGKMLMEALKVAVFQPAGAQTLGEYLNKIFNCTQIGSSLGNLCILNACVKNLVSVSDLQNVCRSGMSTLGFVVETAVRSLKFDLVDLNNGVCEMHDIGYEDRTGDGKMHAITNGEWDMQIRVDGKSKIVKAPFEGKRVGDM
jgi:hypothetical protein